jgi:hypothetical protein
MDPIPGSPLLQELAHLRVLDLVQYPAEVDGYWSIIAEHAYLVQGGIWARRPNTSASVALAMAIPERSPCTRW